MYGLSNVGLMSAQHIGLMSPLPDGLKSSSSPPCKGKAGSGGSPKHGPTPPEAATSKREGGKTTLVSEKERERKVDMNCRLKILQNHIVETV